MANVKISGISATASTIADNDVMEIELADGTSAKISGTTIKAVVKDLIGSTVIAGTNVTKTINATSKEVTLAASGGGGGGTTVKRHPGYVAGQWYRCLPCVQSNGATVADRFSFVPFILGEDATITELGIFVVTAAGTGARIGIYSNNTTTHRPGTKLTEVSVATTSTNAMASAVLATPLALTAGVYWAAVICDGTPSLTNTGTTDPSIAWLLGSSSTATRQENGWNGPTIAYAGGALPNTIVGGGSTSNAGYPIVFHKVQ